MLLVLALLLASCVGVTLDEDESGGEGISQSLPRGLGKGTQDYPYAVGDVLNGTAQSSEGQVWVAGYVVGAAYRSLGTVDFSPSAPYSTSILLSADSVCTDVARCIPIELSTQKWQRQFALPNNPKGYRQCVMLKGVPSTFYYRNGLRLLSAGRWLYGFDLSSVSHDPEEWDTDTISW